jgi:hypothetical protein
LTPARLPGKLAGIKIHYPGSIMRITHTRMSISALAIGLALALAGQAQATSYEYHFTANPGADGDTPADPALDVQYTFGFNGDALPGYSLSVLNNAANWQSGAIWLKASYQGQTVNFADGLVGTDEYGQLSFGERSGVIEAYGSLDEFLDVDLHPGAPFVVSNNLPEDPFVFGQLDVYNAQPEFQQAFDVWAQGDLSSLATHAVVPEPATVSTMLSGLVAIGALMRHRRRQG